MIQYIQYILITIRPEMCAYVRFLSPKKEESI